MTFRRGGIICIAVFIALAQSPGVVYAQSATKSANLNQLSKVFEERLKDHRTQLYYEMLASTDSAQIRLNNNKDIQLMFIDDRGKPVYYLTENINAARTVSTDDVWPGGSGGFSLTGSGTTTGRLGIWDGGAVRATHQEFGGRVTQMDSPGSTHYHATHVAGTMIAQGVQAAAQGMSYQANLAAYDWNSDNSEMATAAAAGMNVSNHSYGYITGWSYSGVWYWYGDIGISTVEDYGFGYYSSGAQSWDQIAYNAPYYNIVKSAGNDRNDTGPGPGGGHYVWNGGWVWSTDTRDPDGGTDGYDCVSYVGNAKNIITVGAVDDIVGGYTAPADVVMSSFSGWGPTDDGRIKPDIVANGINLYSTYDTNNSAYGTLSGTSMSSPNLSGSLNLLVRHYEATHNSNTPRAATMKSVLIQTADESGPNPGPDYMFGWGLMNTLKAAQLIRQDSIAPGIIREDSLQNSLTNEYNLSSDGVQPIRVTIAWTDPAGTPPTPSLNPPDLMLVNDLDIRLVEVGSGTTYYPYILNPASPASAATTGDNFRDNVEQIYLAAPAAGAYVLRVSHKGTLTSTQYYSLSSSHELLVPTSNNPPIALCRNIIVTADASCVANASVDNGSYDPDGDTITLTQNPSGPYPLGITVVSLIVTDPAGLADTCQGNVTVEDNTRPAVVCPADTTVTSDPGQCDKIVTFNISATDNCSGVTVSSNPVSGSAFPPGINPVEVVAVDGSGNADTCYFNVIVNDIEPPIITCPLDTVVNADPGQCSAVVDFTASATDNCPGASISYNPPSGSSFATGTTAIEAIATDGSGNADTCYFNVTVNDSESPVITCPADITVNNDPGQCGAVVSFSATATDNCSGVTISYNPTPGSVFPVGTTPIEAIALDTSGNADTCYFNVIVNDTEPPVISCPSDIIVNNDFGQCGAVVSFNATASDNCTGTTISYNPTSGGLFPVGITSVEVIAVDASGNADTCYFNVTVDDTETPVVSCPGNMVVNADIGLCTAVVTYSATATDNCAGTTISYNPLSGSTFPPGITTVEVIASDVAGNADTCYFNVTVNDNEAPVITCPADIIVNNDPGQCGAVVSFAATATDNCSAPTFNYNPAPGSVFPIGTTSVEAIAIDVSGNADTCYFNVTVNDTELPTAICPADIAVNNDIGQCGAVVNFALNASDNCPGVTVASNPVSGSSFPLGMSSVEVVATDASGNVDTCYFNVTVNDTESPVVTCPVDTLVNADPGQCTAVVTYSATATDNCVGTTLTYNPPSGSVFPSGVTAVEVIATDGSGNADTCYFNVTVNDTEPPVITCPADIVVNNDLGQCGAAVTFAATATDNCSGVTFAYTPASGSLFPIGVTSVEAIASDAAGNADTCYFNVTVNDSEAPTAICPAAIVTNNDPGQCGAAVSFILNVTDNCPGATVTSNPVSGSNFPVGLTSVEVVATDVSGNADTCYFNVTVDDTEPPVAICPADTTLDKDPGTCFATVIFPISVTDNCAGPSVIATPPSGSQFQVGITQVEVVATDVAGNVDTCRFNITVNDNEPPVVVCPADIIVGNDPGQCGAAVTFAPAATDNCGVASINSNPPSGSFFGLGTTPVEVIALDANGNADTCYFNVTVNDTESPTVACPIDTVVASAAGQCGANVIFALSASDNCSGGSIVANPQSGSFFPVGMTPVVVIATDAAGNADTCQFTVTVIDSEAPVVSCPADLAVNNDPGLCSAVVTFTATVTDNCPGSTISYNPPSGSALPVGITTVEVVGIDGAGNADTCYFDVTVNDTEAPVITCPADVIADSSPNLCGAVVSFTVNAADNCPNTIITSIPSSGSAFPVGITQVMSIAQDDAGNADTCYFNVTVNDVINPVAVCPADIAVDNIPGQCGANVSFAVNATDNCPGVSVLANPPSGTYFQIGTNSVEVIAIDASGNRDTCYFNVTVNDSEPPIATCPGDISTTNEPGLCGATATFNFSATDNCPGVSVTANPPSGSFFDIGSTLVSVIAVDVSGNADTCQFFVSVYDTEFPNAGCPGTQIVPNDPGNCGAVVTYDINPTDNCPGFRVNSFPPNGSFLGIGTTPVRIIVTDSSNHPDTCFFNVIVNDVEPPVAVCPADIVVDSEPDQCQAVVLFQISATDNCPGVSVSANPPPGSVFPVGITPVRVIAADVAGNADTCFFNVTVNDIEPPVITCPVDITLDNEPGLCGAVANFTATATDNCTNVNIVTDPVTGSFFPIGTTVVTAIATDDAGLADTCYFNVTVNDIESPIISCPLDQSASSDPGLCEAIVNFSVTATDNCGNFVITSIPPSASAFPVGMTQVMSVADDGTNSDTCYFNVTVIDSEPPVVICPLDTTVVVGMNQTGANVTFSIDGTDNCSVASLSAIPPSGSWFDVGTTPVEVIAVDDAGQADTCYFNVTVDASAPSIPTISEWGMLIMGLMLVLLGTLAIIRRRKYSDVLGESMKY